MMKKYVGVVLLCSLVFGCEKQQQWLEVKSNKADVVPTSLADLQAVLDNDFRLNTEYPSLPLLSSDQYYLSYANWQALGLVTERNAYLWKREIYEGAPGYDWVRAYQRVAIANVALDGLQDMAAEGKNGELFNALKGTALFHRSMAFFQMIQGFCLPYSTASAGGMGIPLKLSSDINEQVVRASLQQSYQRVVADLQQAVGLLPLSVALKTRPSRQAGLILLAKAQLASQDYPAALVSADRAMALDSSLLDYNVVDAKLDFPFPSYQQKHPEVVFHATVSNIGVFRQERMLVDPMLYGSYTAADLRKLLFFRDMGSAGVQFRGHYTAQAGYPFGGLALNELSLIRAECLARIGDGQGAVAELNRLLVRRYRKGAFVPLVATSPAQALGLVIEERRKELPFTGSLRWEDLKRLNLDPGFAITLKRTLNGQVFELPANDPRYIFPIPDDEIRLTKIPQNER